MRVTLLSPPKTILSPRDGARGDMGVPHPGLLCLAEVLLRAGISTSLTDLQLLPEKGSPAEIAAILTEQRPTLIGLTAMTCNYPAIVEVARAIRQTDRRVYIAAGGVHVALNHQEIARSEHGGLFDFICYGEGERTILDIVEHLAGGRRIECIRGVCFRTSSGEVVKTPPAEPLDSPPIIADAWRLLDLDCYRKRGMGLGVAVNTMRGCFGRCSFCSEPIRWHRVSMMSPQDIVTQMVELRQQLAPGYVFFADSNFNISERRTRSFVDEMRNRRLSIPFLFEGRADTFWKQRSLLPGLRQAGAFLAFFGGERFDDGGLGFLSKTVGADTAQRAAQEVHRAEIGLKTTYMFGLPVDTEASIREQARLVQEQISPNVPSFACYTPVPGTDEYAKSIDYIRVRDLRYYTFNNAVCDTDTMNYERVQDCVNEEWFAYWRRPRNRDRALRHPNRVTRDFLEGYYNFIERLS